MSNRNLNKSIKVLKQTRLANIYMHMNFKVYKMTHIVPGEMKLISPMITVMTFMSP